jgi:cbb3-type cytochrome oxidase subunit 3
MSSSFDKFKTQVNFLLFSVVLSILSLFLLGFWAFYHKFSKRNDFKEKMHDGLFLEQEANDSILKTLANN